MAKGCRIILSILVMMVLAVPVLSQYRSTYDPLYGPPSRKSDPVQTVNRLSYQNFKYIKLLQSAVMNYGGGESELTGLVDHYAEASALYFQNKVEAAADKFTENERAILKIAQKLARKYKEDSDRLLNMGLKMNIKQSLKKGLKGEKRNSSADKFLGNAKFGVQKANDYFDRYIKATKASPRGLVMAIYYYRRSKENIFQMIKSLDIEETKKKDLLEKYKRDFEDNKNRVYTSMQKEN